VFDRELRHSTWRRATTRRVIQRVEYIDELPDSDLLVETRS
jgi:hypothetical protein